MWQVTKIVFIFFYITLCQADAYKWTDENNRVYYGDSPEKIDAEKIDFHHEPAGPEPELVKRLDNQRKLIEIYQNERVNSEEKLANEKKIKQEHDQICANLSDYYTELSQGGQLYELDAGGNRHYFDEDSRLHEIASVEENLETHCKQKNF